MLKNIEDEKINVVITKNLSRLGRGYIQTGYYTEVYFQQKHVRYIAVNDGNDTNREDNDIASFNNILNDMYVKDLSRKVKVAKRQRAYKGLFISAQTPYGHKIIGISFSAYLLLGIEFSIGVDVDALRNKVIEIFDEPYTIYY